MKKLLAVIVVAASLMLVMACGNCPTGSNYVNGSCVAYGYGYPSTGTSYYPPGGSYYYPGTSYYPQGNYYSPYGYGTTTTPTPTPMYYGGGYTYPCAGSPYCYYLAN